MKKINEILLIIIFMLTAVLAAAVGLKAYDIYDTNRQLAREQEELELAQVLARNEEAQSRVSQMQAEILELAEDREELERFINRIQSGEMKAAEDGTVSSNEAVSGNSSVSSNGAVSGNNTESSGGTVSGDGTAFPGGAVSGNGTGAFGGMVSGNGAGSSGGTVSGNGAGSSGGMVSGNGTESSGGTVSGNGTVSSGGMVWWNGTVSGNGMGFPYGRGSSGNTVSGNVDAFGNVIPNIRGKVSGNEEINYYDGTMTNSSVFDEWRNIYEQQEEMSLEARRLLRTSLEETLEVNQADRERIAENKTDFSELKIACLGDSITAAANLEGEEGYQQYAYPARLKELLGAEEVYNLGIGGSSIGRYWADAYVDRYQEIPKDTDIIIVMGGTNDGFCVSDKEFGNLEERARRTFCGDLDELMHGLKKNYPDAEIFFATPLPNVLHDYLMNERKYLLPQQKFVDVIKTLAHEYGYGVIDLYNSNILDSHDANVVADYIPDGVHGNRDGYQIMAEHFASELVQYYEEKKNEEAAVSGNNIGA